MELGAEFVLEPNAHFSNLRVNTSLSSVQLPTNVYNKGIPRPMAWHGWVVLVEVNDLALFQRSPSPTSLTQGGESFHRNLGWRKLRDPGLEGVWLSE